MKTPLQITADGDQPAHRLTRRVRSTGELLFDLLPPAPTCLPLSLDLLR